MRALASGAPLGRLVGPPSRCHKSATSSMSSELAERISIERFLSRTRGTARVTFGPRPHRPGGKGHLVEERYRASLLTRWCRRDARDRHVGAYCKARAGDGVDTFDLVIDPLD